MVDDDFMAKHYERINNIIKSGYIPIPNCVKRGIYYVDSRNLTITIFDGGVGFHGIRSGRFDGDEYITAEIHWDDNNCTGTARPKAYLGMLPDDIKMPADEGYKDEPLMHFLDNFKPF